MFWGAVIGFISGLTGMGGGVLLGPLLILNKWVEEKRIAGITASFILINSVVSLIGVLAIFKAPPSYIWYLVIAVTIGGSIGTNYGAKYLKRVYIKKILGLIMIFAGVNIMGGSF